MPLTLKNPIFPLNFSQTGPFLIYFILCCSPLIEGGTTYYPVTIIQIVLLIIFVSGILFFYREGKFLSLKSPLFYSILLFLGYLIIIVFFTPYKLPAFQQVELLLFYSILLYFSLLFHLTRDKFQEIVIALFFVMGTFQAILGIGQYFISHHRAKGTFFNPDYFGEYLAIIFSVLLGRYFDKFKSKLYSGISIGALFILGAGIFLSQSRGAALAWFAGI